MEETEKKKLPGLGDISKNMKKKIKTNQAKIEIKAPEKAPDPASTDKEDQPWYKSSTGQKALIAAVPTLLGAAFGGAKGGQIGAQAGQKGLDIMSAQEKSERAEAKEAEQEAKLDQRYTEEQHQKTLTAEATRRYQSAMTKIKQQEANIKGKAQLQKEQGKVGVDNRLAKLGAEEKKRYDNVIMGKSSINKMAEALAGGDNTFTLWGSNKFTIAKEQWNEALGRMQSGGAINDQERVAFAGMVPDAMDSTEMQAEKLQQMGQLMSSRLTTLGFQPEEVAGFDDPKFKQNISSYTNPAVGGMSQAVASGYSQAVKAPKEMTNEEMKRELGQ